MSEQANLMLWLQANNPQALAQFKVHEKQVADQNAERVMINRLADQKEEGRRLMLDAEKKTNIILRAQKVAEKEKDMKNVDSHTMGIIKDFQRQRKGIDK